MANDALQDESASEDEEINGVDEVHSFTPNPHDIIPRNDPRLFGQQPGMQTTKKQSKKVKPKPRASVMEYKTVNEMYDVFAFPTPWNILLIIIAF